MKVRVGSRYIYESNGFDLINPQVNKLWKKELDRFYQDENRLLDTLYTSMTKPLLWIPKKLYFPSSITPEQIKTGNPTINAKKTQENSKYQLD